MKHHISFDIEFLKNPYPGKLIVVEGIDGSGKTTQAKELVKKLNKADLNASFTKEPTDDLIGKFIRENILSGKVSVSPVATQYLFNADRAMHVEKISEFLKKGVTVVMDRYFWSSVAYAIADMGGAEDFYLTAFSILSFYHRFFIPDITFFLKISPETALSRITESGKHVEIYDNQKTLALTEKSYELLIQKFPESFTITNGERPIEEINEELFDKVKNSITY